MTFKRIAFLSIAVMAAFAAAGCGRSDEGLEPAPINNDPVVFKDAFGSHVDYQAFLNSKYDALQMDTEVKYSGTTSLKVSVPGGTRAALSSTLWGGTCQITTRSHSTRCAARPRRR